MSMITEIEQKCCKCGHKNTVPFLTSTNTFGGSSDLDLRPPDDLRDTMMFWLEECEHCGYVNFDIEKDNGIDINYLKNKNYITCDAMVFKSNLANRFYRYFKIMLELKNYEKAYDALLNVVWLCDDEKDFALAVKFRVWLDEIFENWKPADEKSLVRHADVLRRSGSFDEVIKRYSNFSSSEEIHNEIIQFQLKLSEQKNINAYSIDRMRYETC